MKTYKVYIHRNLINNKVYIGVTSMEPKKRFQENYKHNAQFHKDILEYGWKNFISDIVFETNSKEEAHEKEDFLIKEYDSTNSEKGYNLISGIGITNKEYSIRKSKQFSGEGNPMHGTKRVFTEEHKRKISEGNKGKKLSDEHKQRLRDTNLGKQLSEETKKKISEKNTGRKRTQTSKDKQSKTVKNRTQEEKQKISEKCRERNKNKKFVNNGIINRFIDGSEYEKYISGGWVPGFIVRKKISEESRERYRQAAYKRNKK